MPSVFSPAKINLFLAITGRRPDGFHDLVSVVAPLDFGDRLEVESRASAAGGRFLLECDDPAVPTDEGNLVIKAARAFAAATGWAGAVRFNLTKRIPMGAGLGGGSSNAVAALRALNELAGHPLTAERLAALAAQLGSDCPLFLHDGPVVMRGRGAEIAPLPAGAAARLRGRRVLLFKPSFGIDTAWAYRRMVTRGGDYLPAEEAERRLAAWIASGAPAEDLLFNNMEPAAFGKFVALPTLLGQLRAAGVAAAMTGSGSACLALTGDDQVTRTWKDRIREAWGPGALIEETRTA